MTVHGRGGTSVRVTRQGRTMTVVQDHGGTLLRTARSRRTTVQGRGGTPAGKAPPIQAGVG